MAKQTVSANKRQMQLLTEFVIHFVEEFESKLHAYYLILEGKLEKAGFYADKFSGIIGQAIGGIPTGLIGLLFGVPGVAAAGAAAGKEVAEKAENVIGSKHHRKKIIRLIDLVNRFQNDKANFRQELVEAGFKIFQSYEMQFMKITTDQGPKKAMQLVAKDATNRLISYNVKNKDFEWKNVIEGIVLGKSKTDWRLPSDGHNIRTDGFELDTIDPSEKRWSTAGMFENVGLLREGAYYEKKGKASESAKYGYRRVLDSEDWDKLKGAYYENYEKKGVQNYQYTLPDLSQTILRNILNKINLNDKSLMEKRITELIEELLKEVNNLKEANHIHTENFKILENIGDYLKSINVNEYLNKFEQYCEKNEKDHEKIIELIVRFTKSHKRAIQIFIIPIIILAIALLTHLVTSFNLLEQRQDIYHGDNRKEHKKTQQLIETSLIKQQSKRAVESVWFDVKDSVYEFTGRKAELSDLHSKIYRNPERTTAITQMTAISGLGGIGKTELARKYIQEYGKGFYYILLINSESTLSFTESLSRLAKEKLQIETKDENGKEKNIKYIAEDVYTFLSKNKSLIIFDNAEKNDDFIELLQTFRRSLPPPSEKPYILITSRNREWERGIEVLNLNVLTLQDAIDLVKKTLKAEDSEAKALVEKLQCFPLAIQQALAYIADQGVMGVYNISSYLKEYEKKTQHLLDSKIFNGIENDYEKTTFTTWKITIDKIVKHKEHGELALDILNVIAYLAPENINREMFLVMASRDEVRLNLAVHLLVTYSMVNAEKEQNILSIHRLVQEVIRLELKNQNQEEKVLKIVFDLMEKNFPYSQNKIKDIAKKRQLLPHLEALTLHIDKWLRLNRQQQNAANIEKYVLVITLIWTSDGYITLGESQKGKELLERALAIQEKHYGSEHFYVAATLGNLGMAYGHLGDDQKSKELLERALAIQEKHNGSEHFEVAITLTNLGTAYCKLGDPQKGKELLEKALAIVEKRYGSEHFEVASTLLNLGLTYGSLGDPQKKKELLERALAIQEKHLGSEHFEVAITLTNLGTACDNLGDPQKGKELLEKALAIKEKRYGSEHFEVAATLGNLGMAYGHLGDHQKSKELLEGALAIQEKHYGSEHFEVAITLMNLGTAYDNLGDYQKSKEFLERALAIEEKRYGLEHFQVAATLTNLGVAYYKLSNFQKSKESLERALAIQEKHYGSEHFELAITFMNLGTTYGNLGDPQKKKELLERALAIQEKHDGSENFEVAIILKNLGRAYGDLGNPQKNKELLERALPILEKHYGSEHFKLVEILANLGNINGNLSDLKKCKELLERALAIQEKHYGSEHFEVAITLMNLGTVYGKLGDLEKMKELLERALAIQEKHDGSENFEVAIILAKLGMAYGNLGNPKKKRSCWKGLCQF